MTLTLAIIGAALGVINTAVVLWQWRRSGPLVKVALRAGWYLPGGGIVSHRAVDFAMNPTPDGGRAVLIVAVTNRGRSPVDVAEW